MQTAEERRRLRREERARLRNPDARASSPAEQAIEPDRVTLTQRPKAPVTASTATPDGVKAPEPTTLGVGKTSEDHEAKRDVRRARANSLETWKKARASARDQPEKPRDARNPFEDDDDNRSHRRRGSRRRHGDRHESADRRGRRHTSRSESETNSRSRSRARSRSRSSRRHGSRHGSRHDRGRSRASSSSQGSATNRRRSRSARARSWIRGGGGRRNPSPERTLSVTRVTHRAHERSILFYEYSKKQLSVEFVADEIRRGKWQAKDALYFRVDVVIGRGKTDFDKAWFRLFLRSRAPPDRDGAVPPAVVKYYPERVLGPATEETREEARNLDVGLQVGAPQPVPLGGHFNAGGSGRGNMVVRHRCRLDVTPYRGSTGITAHLWKERTECVLPSKVQLQFVVLYGKASRVDIKGKLDFGTTDGADGLWKQVSTRSWEREQKDFSEWTDEDWRSRGDNRLLEE